MATDMIDKESLSYVEAMRYVKLRPILDKMGVPASKLSKWQHAGRVYAYTSHQPRGKIELRSKVIPYIIPKSVQQSLSTKGFLEPQTEHVTSSRRANINQLREDLREKKPYHTPSDGISKFRVAMGIIEKVYKKYEANLPLHLRPNSSFRHKANVNKILHRVLGPEESIFPTKLKLPVKETPEIDGDSILAVLLPMSTEYVHKWKEIELVHILKRFKLKEIDNIEKEIQEENKSYKAKKKSVMDEASNLERRMFEEEGNATIATQQVHDLKAILVKKDEKVKVLDKKVGDLHRAIVKSLADLDALKMIQLFAFQMSPMTWRKDYDYVHPVDEDTEKILVSLYAKQNLGDGMTGDLNEEMIYLEDVNQYEESHKKVLFFEETKQLLAALEDAEETNLGMIQDSLNIQAQTEEWRVKFVRKEKEYNATIENAEKSVAALSEKVDFEENQAKNLEVVTKMYGMGAKYQEYERAKILKTIKVQVKLTFMEIFGRDTPDFSMVNQLMDIEKEYISLLEEMDFIAPQHVLDLKAKLISDEKRLIVEEYQQARRIAEFVILTKCMIRALAPPLTAEERCRRLVKARSAPPHKLRGGNKSKHVRILGEPKDYDPDNESLESLQKMTKFVL